ncbi:hypothetical protein MMC19_002828 [Ptychographa xylographoides]|nr:hypothetical protein [Ptychographa xylographoides]
MPLHLLGKKSWNVYNVANIEKVKRDEAAAAAQEEAEEQRMQEVDAERRLQLLRGLQAEPEPPITTSDLAIIDPPRTANGLAKERKRRRIDGENDTERDIRYARENQALAPTDDGRRMKRNKTSNAPLTDSAGHINLFPVQGPQRGGSKNAEAEAEKAKKKKEYEDQYTMRFSNAAGFKQAIGQTPWYQNTSAHKDPDEETITKDIWGNEDPRRKEREKMRTAADDPLAMIQRGVQDLRQVEQQRKQWKAEQAREIQELVKAEKRRLRRKKESPDRDSLEDFSLDRSESRRSNHHDRHHRHDESHRHSRKRDRDVIYDRHHSHRSKDRKQETTGWEVGPGGRYSSQFAEVQR